MSLKTGVLLPDINAPLYGDAIPHTAQDVSLGFTRINPPNRKYGVQPAIP